MAASPSVVLKAATTTATVTVPATAAAPQHELVRCCNGTHFKWTDVDDAAENDADSPFLQWWNGSSYARANSKRGAAHWTTKNRRSAVWQFFDQCASAVTGEPAVACKACGRRYVHPSKKNSGTKTLINHVRKCATSTAGGGAAAATTGVDDASGDEQATLQALSENVRHFFGSISFSLYVRPFPFVILHLFGPFEQKRQSKAKRSDG
jgi:hypothetical protein